MTDNIDYKEDYLEYSGIDYLAIRKKLAAHFEDIFQRLLAGEKIDLDREDLHFQLISRILFAGTPVGENTCFDGEANLSSTRRKPRQIEFTGEMWILGDKGDYKEPLRVRVTDKRITKQGILITIWIGSDKAEGDLETAFGLVE